ncbi:MAG: hypothetical protein KatS3mg014_0882 [Actinomycetota bacterium]|nr:MAG: hypothetical protein KatS3mg014_0882 [Actinomycetota bacterium]
MERNRPPGDGVVTGYGTIDGRRVFVASQDFTVFGGSLSEAHGAEDLQGHGPRHEERRPHHRPQRLRRRSHPGGRGQPRRLRRHLPPQHPGLGRRPADLASSWDRAPAAPSTPPPSPTSLSWCGAPATCSSPGRTSSRRSRTRTSPSRSWAAPTCTHQERGGPLRRVERGRVPRGPRRLLSYLPSNNLDDPPRLHADGSRATAGRGPHDIVPDSAQPPYDMHEVIRRVVDHGDFLEVHAASPRNIIVGFARLDGRTVGIVGATSPRSWPGVLDIDASVERAPASCASATPSTSPCVTFVDVPGFLPGRRPGARRHHPPRREAPLRVLPRPPCPR